MVSGKNNQVTNNRVVLNLVQTEEFLDNHKLAEYTAMLRGKYHLNNKILLIQSPQFLLETLNIEVVRNMGCYAFPPTGLQCIAKSISNRNLELSLLDLNYVVLKKIINDGAFDYGRWLDMLDDCLKKFDPSIIGVTSLTANGDVLRATHPLTSLLSYLRKKDRHIIIAGGPTPTSEYEDYLKQNLCHFVVAKEGENKINFLLDSIYNKMPTVPPTNDIYFNYAGAIEQTNGKAESLALKGNLINTYQYIPIEDYKNVGSLNPYSRMAGQDKIFSVFQLNRGCKANCKFCDVSKFMGRGTRNYPADDVASEILYLAERRGVKHFEVLDDDFIGDGHVVVDFLKKLIPIREKYGITWAANNGLIAASITEELMDLIYLSGCIGFKIGIESGNAEMLIKVRKPATLSLLRKKKRILNKYPDMFIGGCYIIGLFEEETFAQMMDSFRFACEMHLDWSSISTFQVTSKVTAAVENFKSKGGVATNFIPPKDYLGRELRETGNVASGRDVFDIPEGTIPSPEQLKQIWFTFNLVLNYINNKNLQLGGNPKKLARWLGALQSSYPENPYMSLFEGLAHVLVGNKESSQMCLEKTRIIINNSDYWMHRFVQFDLLPLVDNFPQDADNVYASIESLRRDYSKWISNKLNDIIVAN